MSWLPELVGNRADDLMSLQRRLIAPVLFVFSLCILCCSTILYAQYEIDQAASGMLFVKPATISGEADISDFTLIYAAGLLNLERIRHHSDVDVYDPFLLTQTVERIIAPLHPVELFSIQYPPLFFVASTPIAMFDLYNAWKVWSLVSILSLTGCYFLTALNSLKSPFAITLGLFLCLNNVAAYQLFSGGQTTGLEAFVLALTLILIKQKRYTNAGLAAALTLFKIHFAPIALIPGICVGKGRFLGGLIIMSTFEFTLSGFVVGWENVFNCIRSNYLCEVVHTYHGLNDIWTMSNLRGVLAMIFPGNQHVTPIAVAVYFLTCLVLCLLWLRLYPRLHSLSNRSFELIASLNVTVLVLLTPHVYVYDYVLLIMPAVWLYAWTCDASSNKTIAEKTSHVLVRLVCVLLAFAPVHLMVHAAGLATGGMLLPDAWLLRTFMNNTIMIGYGLTLLLCSLIALCQVQLASRPLSAMEAS